MTTLPSPTGMFMSEKYDGVRAMVHDGRIFSRNGRDLRAPAWFTRGLPDVRLDCELWMGRGTFDDLVCVIQRRKSEWEGVRLMVLDLAVLRVPIECRHAALAGLVLPPHVEIVRHRVCRSQDDLDATEVAVVNGGGEGLCLRHPGSFYQPFGFIKCKRLHPDWNRSVMD